MVVMARSGKVSHLHQTNERDDHELRAVDEFPPLCLTSCSLLIVESMLVACLLASMCGPCTCMEVKKLFRYKDTGKGVKEGKEIRDLLDNYYQASASGTRQDEHVTCPATISSQDGC